MPRKQQGNAHRKQLGAACHRWPSLLLLPVSAIFASYGPSFRRRPGTSSSSAARTSRVVPNLGRPKPIRVISSPIGAGAPPISSRVFSSNFPSIGPAGRGREPAGRRRHAWRRCGRQGRARGYHAHDPFQRPHHRAAVFPTWPMTRSTIYRGRAARTIFPQCAGGRAVKERRIAQGAGRHAARAKPGSMKLCSGGVGTPTHWRRKRLRLSAAFDASTFRVKSQPEALTEVVAGRVDFYFLSGLPALPAHPRGKLVPAGRQRSETRVGLANVPTTEEAGFRPLSGDCVQHADRALHDLCAVMRAPRMLACGRTLIDWGNLPPPWSARSAAPTRGFAPLTPAERACPADERESRGRPTE